MAGAVYVNGRVTGEADAVVPVFDHGFLYGEGVYEVCRTYAGRVRLLARHLGAPAQLRRAHRPSRAVRRRDAGGADRGDAGRCRLCARIATGCRTPTCACC